MPLWFICLLSGFFLAYKGCVYVENGKLSAGYQRLFWGGIFGFIGAVGPVLGPFWILLLLC
jgi:hypothetical protein